ncbi:MAG TPA: SH3 domain-containing protein [Rhodopila sp.]|nr:SH3 domain-containing protein [Rhodopila sp.]
MHRPVRVLFTFAWLVAGSIGPALGQSGTLQLPSQPQHDQPVRPPAAAPRTPVRNAAYTTDHTADHKTPEHKSPEHKPSEHKTSEHRRSRHKTPVVEPHKDIHAHKAETGTANTPAATAAHPAPATASPAVAGGATPAAPPAPAETKPAASAAPAAKPGEASAEADNSEAAKKVPRFVSLRSDEVNMRAGPGTRYRIEWVYKRRDLPVEIERVFEVWRWVRDPDGIEGWVHQATLMGRRSFIIQHTEATLRSEANDKGTPVAILKVGVIGRIRSCRAASAWCYVQAGSYRGYLRRDQFWGVLPGEVINP